MNEVPLYSACGEFKLSCREWEHVTCCPKNSRRDPVDFLRSTLRNPQHQPSPTPCHPFPD